MSGEHETLPSITSRLPGPPPGVPGEMTLAGPPAATPEPAPVPAPSLEPLPALAHEPPEPPELECGICHTPGGQVPLLVMRGSEPLIRCVGRDACARRLGDRERRTRKPGAGTAEAGPTPPVPAPVPPPDSGAGVCIPPAAPAPGPAQAAATETGASQ